VRTGLQLTGTGPASGAPVPGCGCRRCLASGREGGRRPAGATFGDVVLAPEPVGTARLVEQDGVRVLWGPAAGLLGDDVVAPLAGAGVAVAVLGPAPAGPVTDVARSLARLRAAGALAPGADVVLAGLTHDHPAPGELALQLGAWGMRVVPDDSAVTLGPPATVPAAGPPPRTLVLGGASSGKSALAEELLAAEPAVTYVATGPGAGTDPEWSERVRAHRQRRPPWWRTVETHDVAGALKVAETAVLLDAVGTWLAGVLDRAGAWTADPGWRDAVDGETATLVAAWRERAAVPLVAVAEEVGWGVVPATPGGRLFRTELGRLNQRLAAESERVLLVTAGRVVDLTAAGTCGTEG
jgi:adenosylcobinamide kinase/adenosylcobinamide-phosphate guanylyltransferase